jgi:hypothetical protein
MVVQDLVRTHDVITVVVIAKCLSPKCSCQLIIAARALESCFKEENRTVLKGRDLHRPVVHLDMDAVVAQLRRGDGVLLQLLALCRTLVHRRS